MKITQTRDKPYVSRYDRVESTCKKCNTLKQTSSFIRQHDRKTIVGTVCNACIAYGRHLTYKKRTASTELKFINIVRSRVHKMYKAINTKKRTRTSKLIGTTASKLEAYLILTAINNYGYWYEGCAYHIDHVIPLSWAQSVQEIKKLCHWTNLQYLTPEHNMKKHDYVYDPIVDHKTFTKETA